MAEYEQPMLPGTGGTGWRQGELFSNGEAKPNYPEPEKQPHQMSPAEFEQHPWAVFHTTHLPREEVPYEHMHLGTEQAAIERHASTARVNSSDARMHVFWHNPKQSTGVVHYDEGHHVGEEHSRYEPSEYYQNMAEHPGSISVWVHNPEALHSQADFVKRAIASGKAREVHPETMRQYREGSLGVKEQKFLDTARTIGAPSVMYLHPLGQHLERVRQEVRETLPGMEHSDPHSESVETMRRLGIPERKIDYHSASYTPTPSRGPARGRAGVPMRKSEDFESYPWKPKTYGDLADALHGAYTEDDFNEMVSEHDTSPIKEDVETARTVLKARAAHREKEKQARIAAYEAGTGPDPRAKKVAPAKKAAPPAKKAVPSFMKKPAE